MNSFTICIQMGLLADILIKVKMFQKMNEERYQNLKDFNCRSSSIEYL